MFNDTPEIFPVRIRSDREIEAIQNAYQSALFLRTVLTDAQRIEMRNAYEALPDTSPSVKDIKIVMLYALGETL